MEISSKDDHNVSTAFLTMIKDIHFKNISSDLINDNYEIGKNSFHNKTSFTSNTMLHYKNQKSSSSCCG